MPVYNRLTDRSQVSAVTVNDIFHVVVTGDTSQSPQGSSYFAPISFLQPILSGASGSAGTSGTNVPSVDATAIMILLSSERECNRLQLMLWVTCQKLISVSSTSMYIATHSWCSRTGFLVWLMFVLVI